jgi:hypothetical protein
VRRGAPMTPLGQAVVAILLGLLVAFVLFQLGYFH